MSRIFLDPDSLKQSGTVLLSSQQALISSHSSLYKIQNYPFTLSYAMQAKLTNMMHQISAIQHRMKNISLFMEEASLQYGNASDTLSLNAHQLSAISSKAIASLSVLKQTQHSSKPSKWKSYFWKTTESEFNNFNLNQGLGKIIKDGASIGGTYGAAIAKATYRNQIKNMNVGLDIAGGNFRVTGRAHANWKKDGKFDPNLSASVGAETSLAHGKVFANYDNKYFGAGASAQGSVGVASAKAKAVISKKEVTIEGEVGAALAKGECSGKIKLFGMTFTATLSGEVGAIGASAKYSSTAKSIEFGGKVAFLFGGGFNIKVDY